MNYLSAENISKAYGDLVLFEALTFGMARGDKTALIARNGSGKTTLLRILGGIETSDTGNFTFRNGIKVAFLEQSPELDDTMSIDAFISSSHSKVSAVISRYEKILERQSAEQSEESIKEFEEISAEMDLAGAWDYERRLKLLMDLFRITDSSRIIGSLSGGEKKRFALAMVLLDEPDFLILDEPTNHLDVDMIEWLERYLSQSNLTLLMVTHDRYFLDRVCNNILELDENGLFRYQGNYGYFLEKRAERMAQQKTEIQKANQLMKTELEWLRRMPKARTHKSKSRIDAFDDIRDKALSGIRESEMRLEVKIPRLGGKIQELKGIDKSYDGISILKDLSYKFTKGERIGIIGKNGSGKSTFLDVISGMVKPDAGDIDTGETLVMGYYRQQGSKWKSGQRVIDAVKEIAEVVDLKSGSRISASQFLEHFMFPPETQYKLISKLSGGELRRLHLLSVLIKNPNFLILDEPTNDLDLFALNTLEDFLMSYDGCLIIVSHDRYFLDKLTDHIFVFEGEGKIRDYYGTYSAYKKELGVEKKAAANAAGQQMKSSAGKNKTTRGKESSALKGDAGKPLKLSYNEKREYERLEPEIETIEKEKAALEEELNASGLDYEAIDKKSKRIAALMEEIEEKTLRWMELGERA